MEERIINPKRRIERALIIRGWTVIALCGLLLQSSLGWEEPYTAAFIGIGLPLSFLILSGILYIWRLDCDEFILPIVSFLVGLGILELYRLRPAVAIKQLQWVVLGFLVMLFLVRIIDLRIVEFEKYKYICGIGSVILLLITVIFGKEAGGARAWLAIGPFSFEPSEIVKILLVIFMAGFLKENSALLAKPNLRYFGPIFLLWGAALIILIFQRDLGGAVLFYGTFLGMTYVATSSLIPVITGLLLLIGGGGLSYLLFDHVKVRMAIWLNPWATATGTGYQIVQSLFAMGSGGLFGSGMGQGSPWLIPAVHTDFLFIALHEEIGMLGAIGIIIAYIILIERGFKIAIHVKDRFWQLVAAGLTSALALQVLTIIGGVTKLLPLTGVTLPFLSYGGTSIISNFIILGFLLGISSREGL